MKPFIKTETHRVQDALALLTFRREVRAKREAERILNECSVLAPLATDMPNDRRDLRDRTVLCVSGGPKRMASASAGAYGVNTEHSELLAAAERRANARRFAPQPAMPSAFAQLEQA